MAHGLPVIPLGRHGLHASAQGLGCMSLTKGFYGGEGDLGPEDDRISVIKTALAKGVTLLNTADFYGPYENHLLIGKAIQDVPRKQVLIASKWGPMMDDKGNFSHSATAEYTRSALQISLKNLGVDYIDLYILRTVDHNTPIEETLQSAAGLVKEGLIKGIGLSEVSAANIRKAHAVHPITAVELEWSLFVRDAERDLVPTCRELGIAILAYSPMSRGLLTEGFSVDKLPAADFRLYQPRFSQGNLEQNKKLVEKVKQLAVKKGCTTGQLALSWVHHQGDDVFPIPGTKRVKYLEENIAAFDVKLTKGELAEIDAAVPFEQVAGARSGPHDPLYNSQH